MRILYRGAPTVAGFPAFATVFRHSGGFPMFRALVLAFVLPLAAVAQEPPAKKPADPLARQRAVLHDKKVTSFGESSVKDMTLGAMKDKLEREFREDGLKIILREDLFHIEYADKEAYSQEKFRLDLKPDGLTVHDFLTVALADVNAVYLVRENYIEITTPAAAVAQCFAEGQKATDATPAARLRREPLVSHAATEQTVYDAARQIAFRYGKVLAFDPAVGTRRNKTVSPQWTNVPFPMAIRLLELEAGLDVKETGGVLTLTTPGKKKRDK